VEMEKPVSADEPKEDFVTDEKPVDDENPVAEKTEKMSLDAYLDMETILRMLEDETEDAKSEDEDEDLMNCKYALDEIKKEETEKDFAVIAKGIASKFAKMAKKIKAFAEKENVYLSKIEEFESYKKGIDEQRFNAMVTETLEAAAKNMPEDEIEKAREESKNFSLENIDAWKNAVLATAYKFSSTCKKKNKDESIRWDVLKPIGANKSKEELWTIKKQ
jgi:hypothetical protein